MGKVWSVLMGIIWNLYFLTDDEEEVKESIDEYEKDERLDLEDNDPEYEPEEYGGVETIPMTAH